MEEKTKKEKAYLYPVRIPGWVTDPLVLAYLYPSSVKVLVCLCQHCNKATKTAYPSYSRIQDCTSLSRDTVNRALRQLKLFKIIRSIGKKYHTQEYFINYSKPYEIDIYHLPLPDKPKEK